jgi:hypothetical protein
MHDDTAGEGHCRAVLWGERDLYGQRQPSVAAQRAAIIRWRIDLTVLARAADAPLPADLQQAGRGEIAPSPNGS